MNKIVEQFEKLATEKSEDADFRIYKSLNLNYPVSHRHSFVEFYYITDGKGKDIVNGKSYDLTPGAFLVFSPYNVHKTIADGTSPLQGYVGCISLDKIFKNTSLPVNFEELLFLSQTDKVYYKFEGEKATYLEDIFRRMVVEYSEDRPCKNQMLAAFLAIVLVTFRRAVDSELPGDINQVQNEKVWDIVRYVHNNYQQDITLKQLSDKFYLSTAHICSIFKTYTGKNFLNYLQNIRIKYACSLLKSTDLSVIEIAFECGYNCYESFARNFKSIIGISANDFRKEQNHH